LKKIIGTGALKGNYDGIIGYIFRHATHGRGYTTEAFILRTLKELGIAR
jgi:hypothetical protein